MLIVTWVISTEVGMLSSAVLKPLVYIDRLARHVT